MAESRETCKTDRRVPSGQPSQNRTPYSLTVSPFSLATKSLPLLREVHSGLRAQGDSTSRRPAALSRPLTPRVGIQSAIHAVRCSTAAVPNSAFSPSLSPLLLHGAVSWSRRFLRDKWTGKLPDSSAASTQLRRGLSITNEKFIKIGLFRFVSLC